MFALRKVVSKTFSKTNVIANQVHANGKFFATSSKGVPLEDEEKPWKMKLFKGPTINITEFDAQGIVSILSGIVNDLEKFTMNKTFYLMIQDDPKDDLEVLLFKLQARPTKVQPGNGIVFLCPKGKKKFNPAKTYEELNGALKAHYETNTKQFAEDIKQVFKKCRRITDVPPATSEVVIVWLFEISRRLVKTEKPCDKKKAFDVLPIGCAMARLIRLLELEICLFEDVFLPGGKFHCFSGLPDKRKQAIENINKAISEISKNETVKDLLEELEEAFCYKPTEEQLEEKCKALTVKPASLPVLFTPSYAEQLTMFDYLNLK